MTAAAADPASFRDPASRVFRVGGRILRTVSAAAAADFEALRASRLFDSLVADGRLVAATPVDAASVGSFAAGARYVLEHPRLPFISHPYEWSFAGLKAAALLHLDLHLAALAEDLTLIDGSAYNVQFVGARPVFIDTMSFRRYRDGEVWTGYRQFCEQFLSPLLLTALVGLPFNAWYRGRMDGLPVAELRRLLPMRAYLSRRVLAHVVLHAALERSGPVAPKAAAAAGLPRRGLARMLEGLRAWIAGLAPRGLDASIWRDYARQKSYRLEETEAKRRFVRDFAASRRPAMLWDMGCNTGEFAAVALDAGARYVVGFDADRGALELAFAGAAARGAAFTPLYADLANPSPAQGWGQEERPGLAERGPADAVLALALVHHLAIGRNLPLERIVAWLARLAPAGVVEFVPKSDPQVQRMLATRADIFADYDAARFLELLGARARIVRREALAAGGRELVWYENAGGAP